MRCFLLGFYVGVVMMFFVTAYALDRQMQKGQQNLDKMIEIQKKYR